MLSGIVHSLINEVSSRGVKMCITCSARRQMFFFSKFAFLHAKLQLKISVTANLMTHPPSQHTSSSSTTAPPLCSRTSGIK